MQPEDNLNIYNLSATFKMVQERFITINVLQQSLKSGALYSKESVTLKFLNEFYRINLSSADVSFLDRAQSVPLRDKILILHYFIQAKGTPLKEKQITYRDLPGGMSYYPTFVKRTIKPLVDSFGLNPAFLLDAGKIIGARQGEIGDASLIIDAFAHVPITIILWQGDDEFPAEVNLLFDANITDYLTSEDVTIVCETISRLLINQVKKV